MDKDIIIISTHRSGSSWLGKLLGSSKKILVRDEEIFCRSTNLFCKNSFFPFFKNGSEFFYVCHENSFKYEEHIEKIYNNKFYLFDALSYCNDYNDLKSIMYRKMKCIYRRNHNYKRQIFMECMGVFSAEWLVSKFDCEVLMLIRHPASFVYSIKLFPQFYGPYDFRRLLKQELLMDKVLDDFKEEIANPPSKDDIIGQGILIWRIVNSVIKDYQDKYSHWKVVRLEDLNRNPIDEIKKLYDFFDLAYTESSEAKIIEHSSSKNPTSDLETDFINDRRNSKAMIDIWKNLPEDEIIRIKEGSKDVWKHWYSEADW